MYWDNFGFFLHSKKPYMARDQWKGMTVIHFRTFITNEKIKHFIDLKLSLVHLDFEEIIKM